MAVQAAQDEGEVQPLLPGRLVQVPAEQPLRRGQAVLQGRVVQGQLGRGGPPGGRGDQPSTRSRGPDRAPQASSSRRSQRSRAARASWEMTASGAKPSKPWNPPGHTCSSARPPARQRRVA